MLRPPCKVPEIFARFERNLEILDRLSYTSPLLYFSELCSVGVALIYVTDGHAEASRRF